MSVNIMSGDQKMDKVSLLFLTKNCPDCAYINARLPISRLMDESFQGKDGAKLHIFSALSRASMGVMLSAFGIPEGTQAPVLKAEDGTLITDARMICSYLQQRNLATA